VPNKRAVGSLLVAAVCGLGAVWLVRGWLESQRPEQRTESVLHTAPVAVARAALPAGVKLAIHQIDVVEWPLQHLPSGAQASAESLRGRVLKRAIAEGEPVLESALLPAGTDAGLTPLIRPAHRAMSVKVDAVVGVAGFVKPGARVDVLATVRRVDRTKPVPESQIILQDLRVLAIDQTLEKADHGRPELSSVVTLEVDPEQAQRLAYAAAQGSLQLALRNPADEGTVQTRSVTVRDLVSRAGGDRPQIEAVRGASRSRDAL
jgi:pilus assembly protein CpaB